MAALERHGVAPDIVVADPSFIALGDVERPIVTAALGATTRAQDPGRLALTLQRVLGGREDG